MYTIYNKLKEIAEKEFEDIVKATNFIGKPVPRISYGFISLTIAFWTFGSLRMGTTHITGSTGHKGV